MGFADKLKSIVGIEDIDEDEELEEEVVVKKEPVRPAAPAAPAAPARPMARPVYETPKADAAKPLVTNNRYTNQFKMVVIEPQDFNDSPRLVDSLKAKKPVIINLENLETDVARKIFDFLSGATYALNGNVQKVANNIFVFAPENVDVTYNNPAQKAAAGQTTTDTYKSPWK